ncbi:hypothetical protein [Telluribacter sp.]|jgi:hypothetical protein|uniref:hypothetical protein n=1 Tax=Telluribacter sp. TaxID=1978767 RepID=UPI002E0D8118|nr:hypothetical protein [Telluribacter sp.]
MRKYFGLIVPFLFIVYIANELRLDSKHPDGDTSKLYLQVGVLVFAIGLFVYRLVMLGRRSE